jgi:hypothetical protein
MSTAYSTSNQLFSDEAHLAAQSQIYPIVFNVDREHLRFTTTSLSLGEKEKILDGEMAVDRIVSVKVQWFKSEVEFTIQERFRKKQYMSFQDITITEWNNSTNLKSELFKLNAGIFVYGYFDMKQGDILDWIAVNTVGLLHSLVIKEPRVNRGINPRSNQSFLTFKFCDLENDGFVIARKKMEAICESPTM